ncbi:MAG: hypothetical protein ACJAUP_002958 [Cellvibrionaceae bacterium]|jgi:hypothetical protein
MDSDEKPKIKNKWPKRLYEHYTLPPEKIFPQFKLGAVIFFMGLVIMYGANQLLVPSLAQEIVTLVGLLLIGGGFILALMTQIRMLVGRILRFFFED